MVNHRANFKIFKSLGNYSLKRCLSYLNTSDYKNNLFRCQILKSGTELHQSFVRRLGATTDLKILRCRLPSAHKQTNYNYDGYRVVIAYYSVENFSISDPYRLVLAGNQPGINLDKNDYYFQSFLKGYWCSCKSGQRTLGACSHVIACIVGLGRPKDYSKGRFIIVDPNARQNI